MAKDWSIERPSVVFDVENSAGKTIPHLKNIPSIATNGIEGMTSGVAQGRLVNRVTY